MKLLITHMDISPAANKKCCQNCKEFNKFGVHLGYCCRKGKEKLDTERCKFFEFKTKKEIE